MAKQVQTSQVKSMSGVFATYLRYVFGGTEDSKTHLLLVEGEGARRSQMLIILTCFHSFDLLRIQSIHVIKNS